MEERLIEEFRYGLDHDEFLMYLQPKVDLKCMEVHSAEALARWKHPTKGLLLPSDFIEVLVEHKVIDELDFYMIEKACQYIKARMDRQDDMLAISVNVSRITLTDEHFFERLNGLANHYGIPHTYLEIEILENDLRDIEDQVIDILTQVKAAGFLVSIDDFGAGYSNFNLINRLPIDIIKLDREFMINADRIERTKGLIACLIDMGHAMKMKILCEGVETEANLLFLKKIGCDYVQGYFFSKPVPVDEFEHHYNMRRPIESIPVREAPPIVYPIISISSEDNNLYEKIMTRTYPGLLSLRDENHRIVYLNDNFRNWIKEYTDVDPIGKTNVELAELVPNNVAETFLQCHDGSMELVANKDKTTSLKKLIVLKEKDESQNMYLEAHKIWVHLDGKPYIYTISYDITHLYTENMSNLHKSMTDYLTGTKNRRYLQSEMDLYHGYIAVLFDIDNFEYVNEHMGYMVGDDVLKSFVDFINHSLPYIKTIIRTNGDEFLVVFDKEFKDVEKTLQRARRIYNQANCHGHLSFSYGVGMISEDIDETLTLLRRMLKKDQQREKL